MPGNIIPGTWQKLGANKDNTEYDKYIFHRISLLCTVLNNT